MDDYVFLDDLHVIIDTCPEVIHVRGFIQEKKMKQTFVNRRRSSIDSCVHVQALK